MPAKPPSQMPHSWPGSLCCPRKPPTALGHSGSLTCPQAPAASLRPCRQLFGLPRPRPGVRRARPALQDSLGTSGAGALGALVTTGATSPSSRGPPSPQPRTTRPQELPLPLGQAHRQGPQKVRGGGAASPGPLRRRGCGSHLLSFLTAPPARVSVPRMCASALYTSTHEVLEATLPEGAVTPAHREETEAQPPRTKRTSRKKTSRRDKDLSLQPLCGGAPSCWLGTLAPQRLRNKAWAASQGPAHTIPLCPCGLYPAQPPSCPESEAAGPGQPCSASRHPGGKGSGSSAIPGQDPGLWARLMKAHPGHASQC